MRARPVEPSAVTVVVPARDEETSIAAVVDSLHRGTARPAGVLVVDAGSSDDTAAVARGCPGVEVESIGPAWPGEARNHGVRAVSTPWVMLVDAGVSVAPDALAVLVRGAVDHPAARMVIGGFACGGDTLWRQAVIVATKPAREVCGGEWGRYDFMPCLVEHDFFEDLGGFRDWRAAEDLDFVARARAIDGAVVNAPGVIASWGMADSPVAMFTKWRLYAFHNAGTGTGWHRRVILHAAGSGVVSAGMVTLWGLVGLLGLVVPHVARTVVRYARHVGSGDDEVSGGLRVVLLAVIASVASDVATLLGWWSWRLRRSAKR